MLNASGICQKQPNQLKAVNVNKDYYSFKTKKPE